MTYWLIKSEPSTYSIDDLEREEVGSWEGVRNFQARNNLRAMQVGDLAYFYHSNAEPPGVAGICEVARAAYPDHTQFEPASAYFDPKATPENPRWFMPDVRFVRRFDRLIPLAELRSVPGLEEMELLRRSRLSVQRVADKEWEIVLQIAEGA